MKYIINKSGFFYILLMLVSLQTHAVEDAPLTAIKSDPMSSQYLIQLVLGLLVVLVCIVVLAWLAKRMNRLQSSTGGVLKILGGMSMGSRERIVLLQVGDSQLLIGVAPGRINTLHVLDKNVEDSTGSVDANSNNDITGSFADKLKSIIVDGGK